MTTPVKPHILVVDDEPDFAAYLRTVLEEEGFLVTTAFDGDEALRHVRDLPPDLVTLDISMPRKTGVLFYRQMKSEERLRSIPVIVITGLRRTNAYAAPFIDRFFKFNDQTLPEPEAFFDKPVEKATLLSAVKERLGATAVGLGT
ncbi:MAG: two-component system response regulator [Acidithiobacillales bacterium]